MAHRIVFNNVKKGWESKVLLMSDEHWDNAHADLPLIKRHHEQAVACNAPIVKVGDTFCLMQGKWDKRADQNQLRTEHRGAAYFDKVIDTAGEFYAPYAKNIALITPGNHEESILDHHNTDIVERFISEVKHRSGHRIMRGTYSSFLVIAIKLSDGRIHDKVIVHLHHGYGGGGEVTRGMIDNNRTRGQYFADIYYSGHIHRRNMDENELVSCNTDGIIRKHRQWFLRGSCYKDELNHGEASFHVKGGRAGRPKGGWWLNLSYHNMRIEVMPTPA